MEELPSVRNLDHKQIIWIDEDVDEGIKIVNNLRRQVLSSDPFLYLSTDILPFRNNEILQLWLETHGYYCGLKEKTVVVFTLPDNHEERIWRLKFIKDHFPAQKYICLGNYRRSRKLLSEASVESLFPTLQYYEKTDSIK